LLSPSDSPFPSFCYPASMAFEVVIAHLHCFKLPMEFQMFVCVVVVVLFFISSLRPNSSSAISCCPRHLLSSRPVRQTFIKLTPFNGLSYDMALLRRRSFSSVWPACPLNEVRQHRCCIALLNRRQPAQMSCCCRLR
jgi:hypothetical protein